MLLEAKQQNGRKPKHTVNQSKNKKTNVQLVFQVKGI